MTATPGRREPGRASDAPERVKPPSRRRTGIAEAPERGGDKDPPAPSEGEGIGATEDQIGDRTGPGVGFDQEHPQNKDEGGVA